MGRDRGGGGGEDYEDEDQDEDFTDEHEHADDDPEKTLVAQAGSAITSGFQAVGKKVRFPMWARFITAGLVIVSSVAAATSASLLLYLSDIATALDPDKEFEGITNRLDTVEGGEPQTIMILGSDKRPELKGDSFRGLSDTTMLLRVDPDRNALALFSLPRDLRVDIPGYGSTKLNEAYAYGGPELTLRTVQNLTRTPSTPDGLEINHVVNIDFEGFARAVNALECVYVDVDRRYFNTNDDSLSEADDYEEIDIQPGYQALCGFDALDYARYRHTDNDVVRAARQQDFLREARQKVPPEVLFAERKELISIFTEHTTSDIDTAESMLQVLKLFIEARDAPLKQVKFEGTLGPSFVETTQAEINKAVTQFLGLEDSPGARASTSAPEDPSRVPDVAPDSSEIEDDATDSGDEKKEAKSDGGSDTGGSGGAAASPASSSPRSARTSPRASARARSSCPCTTRPGSSPARTTTRSRASTRSTGPAGTLRRIPSAPPTSGCSRAPSSASTTASWGPAGRTRRSSRTPTRSGRSGTGPTSSSTTETGCGWSPGRKTRAPSG